MAKLYELSAQLRELEDLLLQEQDAETAQAVTDTLEAVQGEFTEKAIAIGKLVKEMQADLPAYKAEIDRLQAKKKQIEAAVERLKNYLQEEMNSVGKEIIQSPQCTLAIRANPPAIVIENEQEFIEWAKLHKKDIFIRQPSPEINRKELAKAVKDGEEIEGVTLERTERLQIK